MYCASLKMQRKYNHFIDQLINSLNFLNATAINNFFSNVLPHLQKSDNICNVDLFQTLSKLIIWCLNCLLHIQICWTELASMIFKCYSLPEMGLMNGHVVIKMMRAQVLEKVNLLMRYKAKSWPERGTKGKIRDCPEINLESTF